MHMSLGHSLRQTQRLTQSLRLSQEQRLVVQQQSLALRLQLVEALRGERYEPQARCPACNRKLTPVEIIRGFNQDPQDYTTRCSGCGHRFAPSLICFGNGSEIVLPFFCDAQTLAQMHGKETLAPEVFAREHPAIYRSAVVHHGGVRSAFAKIGIAYPFEEVSDWKTKIAPFLGRMPDTIIAECVHQPPRAIRRLRRDLGVGRYTLRAALAEAGIEA